MSTGHSDAWHKSRLTGIGGSDIAAIAGLDKYRSPMTVYLDKIGVPGDNPESEAMEWGTRHEATVAEKFAELHPEYIMWKATESDGEETLYRHPDHRWAVAHPDRMLMSDADDAPDPTALWECKTAGREARKAAWTVNGNEYPPPNVIAQVQWYMAVVGVPFAWVSVLFEGRNYREWRVERDDAMIDLLMAKGEEFWGWVEDRTPPAIDGSSATADVLAILYRETVDEEIELPVALGSIAQQRIEAKARLDTAKQEVQGLDNQLKAALGEHETGHAGAYTVTWRSRNGRRTADVKALEADGLTQYVKQGEPFRVLDVKEEE